MAGGNFGEVDLDKHQDLDGVVHTDRNVTFATVVYWMGNSSLCVLHSMTK